MLLRWAALDSSFAAFASAGPGGGRSRATRDRASSRRTLIGNDLEIGQEVVGTVIRISKVGAYLDIGADRRGWLHIGEVQKEYTADLRKELRVGEEVKARVTAVNTHEVSVTMLRDKAIFSARPLSDFEDGDEVEGTVTHSFGSKCFVDVGAMVQAYLGIQQVREAREDPDTFREMFPVGRRITAKVLRREPSRLTLSWTSLKADDLEIGQEVKGRVRKILQAGADLDIGADRRGWLHVGQIREGFIENVSEVLSVGDEVDVRVKSVLDDSVHVSLRDDLPMWSRRPLLEFEKGDVVQGKIVYTSTQAVFFDVGAMVDAYLAIDQVNERGEEPTDLKAMFKKGKLLEAKVLRSGPNKLSLTLRTDVGV